jgi:hypothetical protein
VPTSCFRPVADRERAGGGLKVDLIVAGAAVAIRAAHDATTTIPIGMAFSGEAPVRSGFVTKPRAARRECHWGDCGRARLGPKTLELLHDAVPALAYHRRAGDVIEAQRCSGLEGGANSS